MIVSALSESFTTDAPAAPLSMMINVIFVPLSIYLMAPLAFVAEPVHAEYRYSDAELTAGVVVLSYTNTTVEAITFLSAIILHRS